MTTLQLDRFMRKIDIVPGGCWEWRATKTDGYGMFNIGGRMRLSHKALYEHQESAVPYPLELDHLCRNRGCCNPHHLEVVTHIENIQRGGTGTLNSAQAAKTHCPKGHPLEGSNLLTGISTHGRQCRTCHNTRQRKYKSGRMGRRKQSQDSLPG